MSRAIGLFSLPSVFAFAFRRLLQAIPVLFAVATLTFVMVRMAPGDPFADEQGMPEAVRERMMEHYGLNDPLYLQYLRFLGHAVRLDLGYSLSHPTFSVNEIIANHFPVTVQYALPGFLLALLIGIPVGMGAAYFQGRWQDRLPMLLALIGICLPTFVLGPLLSLWIGSGWQWLPPLGWADWSDPGMSWREIAAFRVLPAVTLAFFYAAYVARLTRSGTVEVLEREFITAARAKGVSEWRILLKHTPRMGLLPVVAYLGPALAGILTGSFVIETIFEIPGLGVLFIEAATDRDYPLILGLVVFYAVLILLFNFVVDLLQATLNPRIRME